MQPQTTADLEQQLARDFAQRLIDLPGGAQVAWREAGDASASNAVVLLHGISSGAASWLAVAQQLVQQPAWQEQAACRVLAWDAPGYGASTPLVSASPRDVDYAQVLAQSLQALGVRRCVLVGHSLGALMVAAFARQTQQVEVTKLVLISPAGGYGAAGNQEQQARVRENRQSGLATKGVAGLAASIDQRLLSPAADGVARSWVRWNTARLHAAGYLQAVELLCGSDLGMAQGQLPMPVQVWVGEHDVVTTPAACEKWAQRLGAHYGVLTAAGHASPIEQPQAVADVLLAALRG